MEQDGAGQGQEISKGSWLKMPLLVPGKALVSLFRKGPVLSESEAELEEERKLRRMALHSWIIVCAIAVLFVAYGFLAFFIVGDKGSPDWDYGSVKDVPAQSVYSTYPYREHAGPPEAQHVDQRPADAKIGVSEKGKPATSDKRPEQER